MVKILSSILLNINKSLLHILIKPLPGITINWMLHIDEFLHFSLNTFIYDGYS